MKLAELAHFYGWTDEEIRRLDSGRAEAYWMAITQIEARHLLLRLRVADYPQLKAKARSATHRAWHKLAYPKTYDETERVTTAELAERIQAAMRHG